MAEKKQNMGALIHDFMAPGYCAEAAKRFPTGIPQLDKKLHGGFPNGLNSITAGPSEGKTTMGLQISSNLSVAGIKVFLFLTEMIDQKIAANFISRQSFINDSDTALTSTEVIEQCNDGKMMPVLTSAIDEASAACKNITLYDCNSWRHTVKEIVDAVTEYKNSHNEEDVFVIVDYLQELERTDEESKMERKDFIDHAIITLKELSEELQIPILVMCAINRDNGYVGETSMSQIKDSGRLEYNFDTIIAIERGSSSMFNPAVRNVNFHILKQKDGEANIKIACKYYCAYNYFKDAHKVTEKDSSHDTSLEDKLNGLDERGFDPEE